jgi:pilus assembly protein CpaB
VDRKKILIIFVGAWLSAAVLTWFLYASTRAPKAEKTVSIMAAARDMPAGTRLQKGDVKKIRVLEADAPKSAVADEKQLLDRALLFPVTANEPITPTKVTGTTGVEGVPATIEIGKRAIAVQINDTTGVAGLIQPRAHVDVLFTRSGSLADSVTSTILEDVVVLAIGRTTETTNSTTPAAAATTTTTTNRAATLLVTPEQARILELAKKQGTVSLVLRNPLDTTTAPPGATTAGSLYADGKIPGPRRTAAAADPPPPPKIEPPKPVIVEHKEEPKPKKRIDVFRGDKHVQESFE